MRASGEKRAHAQLLRTTARRQPGASRTGVSLRCLGTQASAVADGPQAATAHVALRGSSFPLGAVLCVAPWFAVPRCGDSVCAVCL